MAASAIGISIFGPGLKSSLRASGIEFEAAPYAVFAQLVEKSLGAGK
jgi:hypothetical protein